MTLGDIQIVNETFWYSMICLIFCVSWICFLLAVWSFTNSLWKINAMVIVISRLIKYPLSHCFMRLMLSHDYESCQSCVAVVVFNVPFTASSCVFKVITLISSNLKLLHIIQRVNSFYLITIKCVIKL